MFASQLSPNCPHHGATLYNHSCGENTSRDISGENFGKGTWQLLRKKKKVIISKMPSPKKRHATHMVMVLWSEAPSTRRLDPLVVCCLRVNLLFSHSLRKQREKKQKKKTVFNLLIYRGLGLKELLPRRRRTMTMTKIRSRKDLRQIWSWSSEDSFPTATQKMSPGDRETIPPPAENPEGQRHTN